jgi:cytochrome c oxidase cbb3-type subunit III
MTQHSVGMRQTVGSSCLRARSFICAVAGTFALLSGLWYWLHARSLDAELLRQWPAEVARSPSLVRFAVAVARPVYAAHCAFCHGIGLGGNGAIGAPNLVGPDWLYGDRGIGDIEATILYGIRSGHPKSHNVTDMPAEGRSHQLTPAEVDDVVEYVLALSEQRHDEAAAHRGRVIFYDKGNCFDCHANDAQGNTDYGAPSLLGHDWLYGGDRQTLRQTVYNGRHGLCPAWINQLSPVQIRALAVYLYVNTFPMR